MGRTTPVVAGLDLAGTRMGEADGFAELVLERIDRVGLPADTVHVCAHRVVTGHGETRVAATITAPALQEWQGARLCGEIARGWSVGAWAVGRSSDGGGDALAAARAAVEERSTRTGGRSLVFPGIERLRPTMTVGDIVDVSAIDSVAEIGGRALPRDAVVTTGARPDPRWEFGDLTLRVLRLSDGRYAPFETSPTGDRALHAGRR